mgnify:CR=1 FL=1
MKSRRFLSAFLCAVLALTLLTPAALANSWGLKSGMILNAVSKTHDYDEYTALAQLKLPDGEVAVMASRYHAVLLYAYQFKGELRLEASHTAVKQPDEKDYKKVKLQAESPGFVLKYSDMELHFYPWVGYKRRTYTLQSGKIGKLTLQPGGVNSEATGWLTCSDGENTVDWFVADEGVLTLTQLNLRLFPRTMDELGAMRELINVVAPQFVDYELYSADEMPGDAGAATVPVYSAPGDGSVRFAKGKASVNLRAPVKFYGLSRDESWMLVEYEVSDRTSRFGYVKRSELPCSMAQTQTMIFSSIDMPVTITKDTYLTDDPNVSQYRQMTLKAGGSVRLLALYGAWYAYVETTLEGKTVRGFVPRACLCCPLPTEEDPEVAQRLLGEWQCSGGGEVLGDYVTFQPDGRAATSGLPLERMKTLSPQEREEYGEPVWESYQVYKSTARERANFWNECAHILVFRDDTGYISGFYGLMLDTDEEGREAFSVLFGEGGGGYTRYDGDGGEGVNG